MTAKLPPWDPDDYDRRIKAGRIREQRERRGKPAPVTEQESYGMTRASQPRLMRNGRWKASKQIDGRRYQERFDTRAEAQAWLDLVQGDGDG